MNRDDQLDGPALLAATTLLGIVLLRSDVSEPADVVIHAHATLDDAIARMLDDYRRRTTAPPEA